MTGLIGWLATKSLGGAGVSRHFDAAAAERGAAGEHWSIGRKQAHPAGSAPAECYAVAFSFSSGGKHRPKETAAPSQLGRACLHVLARGVSDDPH